MTEQEKNLTEGEEIRPENVAEELAQEQNQETNPEETVAEPTTEERLAAAEARIAELEKDRLYKQAEFDNYRKNVMKEKTELILNGGRKVLESMLPVVDDFELALQHMDTAEDVAAVREGVELIQKKFMQVLKTYGVEQMATEGKDFDTDYHEAIAQFPAPNDEAKGKIIDCTKKGYTINDKVLRFAQVVVGI